jgi:hypothetical protein
LSTWFIFHFRLSTWDFINEEFRVIAMASTGLIAGPNSG